MSAKCVRLLLTCAICLFFAVTATALDSAEVLAAIQKKKFNPEEFGIFVTQGDRKILGLNEAKKFKPASLTKVITGAAALEFLGPHFKFRTQLLQDGTIEGQTIRGTLFLRNAGDPSFLSTQLFSFVTKMVELNIKTVEGDLVIDDSPFRNVFPANWQSQISTLNPKMFPIFLTQDPPAGLTFNSSQWVEAEKGHRKMRNIEGRFVVYENIAEPDLWSGYQLKEMLEKRGIKITGKVIPGRVSKSAQVIAEIVNPLTTVVRKMMKTSNNYYADTLIRDMPLRFGEQYSKFEDGMEFMKYYLDHANIARGEYSLNSGSGFSHQNFITPSAIVKLFLHLRHHADVTEDFYGTLPVAGVDGTLRSRMRNTAATGRVHAKTGYLRPVQNITARLTGAVGLAGYIDRPDGKIYTFAFLYNGMGDPAAIRKMFDSFCIDLMGSGRTLTAQIKTNSNRARK